MKISVSTTADDRKKLFEPFFAHKTELVDSVPFLVAYENEIKIVLSEPTRKILVDSNNLWWLAKVCQFFVWFEIWRQLPPDHPLKSVFAIDKSMLKPQWEWVREIANTLREKQPRHTYYMWGNGLLGDVLTVCAHTYSFLPHTTVAFAGKSWPTIKTALETAEKAWQAANEGFTKEAGKVVVDCGNGWVWVNLEKPCSKAEGDAMGHCGNVPTAEAHHTLLSLRKKMPKGRFEPHATFVLDTRNGAIGEAKGRNNAKPLAEYHPHILKLLMEYDPIKKLVGGGWDPANNFDVWDLTDAQRTQLFAAKPAFKDFTYYTKAVIADRGKDPLLLNAWWRRFTWRYRKLVGKLTINGSNTLVRKWDSLKEYADDFGLKELSDYSKYADGSEYIDFYGSDLGSYAIENLLELLPATVKTQLATFFTTNFASELADDELDVTNDRDLVRAIERGISHEVTAAFERADNTATEDGAMDELFRSIGSTLQSNGVEYRNHEQCLLWRPPLAMAEMIGSYPRFFDDRASDPLQALDMAGDFDTNDLQEYFDQSDLNVPYNGWEGWDKDAARETLLGGLPDILGQPS